VDATKLIGGVMAGEPVPDPTIATNEAVERAVTAERDYVNGQIAILVERLNAMDVATRLLSETVNRVPTVVQTEIAHIFGLMEEKFSSVQKQFDERDTRTEREARDNKLAVDAAFAAQEKQAVAQNESNALAINKSEAATTETIKANQELSRSKTDALTKDIDALKLAVSRIEATKVGNEQTAASVYALAGVIAMVLLVILAVAGYAATH
jgi:VIT1/CCC1 family predicted Fe2+/Mn2+ transporter